MVLDSLTKTGLIADFEQHNGIPVEVLHKNDHTIMSDLDRGPTRGDTLDVIVVRHRLLGALLQKGQVQPINSLLADSSCTTQASCRGINSSPLVAGTQLLRRQHIRVSLHRPDDFPVLSQRFSG